MLSDNGFAPIEVSILSGLESAGDTISRQGHIDVKEIKLGGHCFRVEDGLDYDVALTNTGDGILATGIVRGTSTAACDRCLDDTQVDISGEVSCYYLREAHVDAVDDEDDDASDDYGIISSEGTIDLADAIHSAVVMDLPYVVLCSEDCKGLCPYCGANLNHESCDCASKRASAVDPLSPFAALAGLRFDVEQDDSAVPEDSVSDDGAQSDDESDALSGSSSGASKRADGTDAGSQE